MTERSKVPPGLLVGSGDDIRRNSHQNCRQIIPPSHGQFNQFYCTFSHTTCNKSNTLCVSMALHLL